MTELEYEKACRGPVPPVQNEYAWGTVNISNTTAIANDGTGIDTQTGGNAIYNWGIPYGPARVGMYATGNSSREAAGASYWGIMELSGNLHEVTVSTIWGTGFTGLHGDGKLSVGGNADVVNWPGITAYGSGFRGGEYDSSVTDLRVSDRRLANAYDASRYSMFGGGRYVRTAPVGLGP